MGCGGLEQDTQLLLFPEARKKSCPLQVCVCERESELGRVICEIVPPAF